MRFFHMSLVLGLVACGRRESAPIEQPPPVASAVTEEPRTGPVSAAWLRDLPAPSTSPRSVGGPPQIAGGYEDFLGSIVVDGEDVYVADSKREQAWQEVVVVPARGDARVIARTEPLPSPFTEELFGVAVDATHVYVASSVRTSDASRVAYAVRAAPKAGGVARVLVRGDLAADGLATDLEVAGDSLYLLLRGDRPGADPYAASIVRLAKTGGDPVQVIEGVRGHYPWAIDDGFLYHEVGGARVGVKRPGKLARTPLDGGAAEVIAEVDDSIGAIVLAESHVVFTEMRDGALAIQRVPKQGGQPELVAQFDGFPHAIDVDRGVVYWAVLAEDLGLPAKLLARRIRDADMPPARDTGVTLPRGPSWTVKDGVLYVPRSNGVDRTPVKL